MYSVIIVDDEKLVREGFIRMMERPETNFKIVGQASNGKEALELIEKLIPDIVVTDIRMPVMDGIELTKTIKNRYSDIEVIALSGFNDYEYVREAMKYGALDYILKSRVDYNELISTLDKSKLGKRVSRIECSKGNPDIYANILNNLILYKEKDSDVYESVFKKFDIKLIQDNLLFLTFSIDLKNIFKGSGNNVQLLSLRDNLKMIIQDTLSSSYLHYTFTNDEDKIIVLLNCKKENYDNLSSLCRNIILNFNKLYFTGAWAIIGDSFSGFDKVYSYYSNTLTCFQYGFYGKKNNVFQADYFSKTESFFTMDYKIVEELIDQRNFVKILVLLKEAIDDKINKGIFVEIFVFKKRIEELFNFIIYHLQNLNYDLDEISLDKFNYFRQIEASASIDELFSILNRFIFELDQCLNNNNKYSPLIKDILIYIQKNYKSDITLASVADVFHVNKSYLCQLFRKQINENFNDYITNLRINKAKELLKKNDSNIYVIASEVGYTNTGYFSMIFQKITGCKPTKFRNMNKDI